MLWIRPFVEPWSRPPTALAADLVDAFLVTAPLEEAAKLLACLLGAFFLRTIRDPREGLLYGVAAGLGFASSENAIYLIQTRSADILLVRSFTSTLAHVGFTGSLAYAVAVTRFRRRHRWPVVPAAFATAVVLHGAYNHLLVQGKPLQWLALLAVLPLSLGALSFKWNSLQPVGVDVRCLAPRPATAGGKRCAPRG